MTKRVLVAGLYHETHTFLRGETGLADFTACAGEALLASEGDASALGGALRVAGECGWDVVPALDLMATPSATVADDVLEHFWAAFRAAAERARSVDGVFLSLHGAMACRSFPDAEGELLRRLRALPGYESIPVGGVLDLHANVTHGMASRSNALVAYRENPHTDIHETGMRAARLLDHLLETGELPVTVRAQPAVVWPPTGTGTADEPMCTLEAAARALEAAHTDLLAVNVFAGFSFADVAEAGVSFTAVTLGDPDAARAQLNALCLLAEERCEQGCRSGLSLSDALDRALADLRSSGGDGPALLVEPADNIGGGAPGDCTHVLRALVERNIADAAVCLNDPEAVAVLWDAPIGSVHALPLGGKSGELGVGEPVVLAVKKVSRSDGRFTLEDRHSHAAASGLQQDMGRCVVVRAGGVTILLTSRKTPPFDLGQWRSQGINPDQLSVIGVKAAVAHRRAYDPIARASYTVDTPGPCAEDLSRLSFQQIRRPVFPLDGSGQL
jgi:microcystin degradation protein MlrC